MRRGPLLLRLPPFLLPLVTLAALALTPPAASAAGGPVWVGHQPVRWTPARLVATAPAAQMRVARDPDTGLLGLPTPAESERLAAASAAVRPAVPLHEVRLPDGSVMVDLQGQFMWDVVVARGADGRLHAVCSDDPREVARALAGAPAANPQPLPEE